MDNLSHSQVAPVRDDRVADAALRPVTWDEYIGQDRIKKNLRVIINAAKKREETIDHVLFYGQAGLGKTTLAHIVAREAGATLKVTSGPALEKMGDLVATLSNLEPGETLFVDEIHRLNRSIEEVLYPAMESRKLNLVVGKGPGARILTLDLPPFTLLAATTRADLLSSPLRSRFGATFKLSYYDSEAIKKIIHRSAQLLSIGIDDDAVRILAEASRATPRVANRLLRRARDFAQVAGEASITSTIAKETLELLEIDSLGLESFDRALLEIIVAKFNGGPVGIKTLSAALNEEQGVIEEVYEPYLIMAGLLHRTPAGRVVTEAARRHLGASQNLL